MSKKPSKDTARQSSAGFESPELSEDTLLLSSPGPASREPSGAAQDVPSTVRRDALMLSTEKRPGPTPSTEKHSPRPLTPGTIKRTAPLPPSVPSPLAAEETSPLLAGTSREPETKPAKHPTQEAKAAAQSAVAVPNLLDVFCGLVGPTTTSDTSVEPGTSPTEAEVVVQKAEAAHQTATEPPESAEPGADEADDQEAPPPPQPPILEYTPSTSEQQPDAAAEKPSERESSIKSDALIPPSLLQLPRAISQSEVVEGGSPQAQSSHHSQRSQPSLQGSPPARHSDGEEEENQDGFSTAPLASKAEDKKKLSMDMPPGRRRWSKLAEAFAYQKPGESELSIPSEHSRSNLPSSSSRTKKEKSQEELEDPEMTEFKKEVQVIKFIAKMRAGEQKMRERREEEAFIPTDKRRFLFDLEMLKTVKTMNAILKAHVDDDIPEEDFNKLVDRDDACIASFVATELVGNFLESLYFRFFIMFLIILNSLIIGIQTDETLASEYSIAFSIFDQAVLATFTCELLLKWYYGFWIFWKVGWNILDFVIIVALLLGPQLAFLSSSRILRILRVLRAFRSLRSVSALAGLSMVVQTILQSVPDMVNIVLLLFIILLVLAVSGVTLFGRRIPHHYGDLQTAMFSLFICVTQDGWVDIYNEFVKQGYLMRIQGAIYLFLSIMVGAFIFANLVVAVVVTNLENAVRELQAENEAEVDELATSPTNAPDRTISGDSDTAPVKTFEQVKINVDFTMRKPILKGDLKGLTLSKMERYCLVLAALEANLAEYEVQKKDLLQILSLITDLNTEERDDDAHKVTSIEKSAKEWLDGRPKSRAMTIDYSAFKKGDILSNLMKLEESQAITSDAANDMSSVIRTAGKAGGRRKQSLTAMRVYKAGRRRSLGDQPGYLPPDIQSDSKEHT